MNVKPRCSQAMVVLVGILVVAPVLQAQRQATPFAAEALLDQRLQVACERWNRAFSCERDSYPGGG
jgi:hypothetical protein